MEDAVAFELSCDDLDVVLIELIGPPALYENLSEDPARVVWNRLLGAKTQCVAGLTSAAMSLPPEAARDLILRLLIRKGLRAADPEFTTRVDALTRAMTAIGAALP